jgi:hypothetical protein
VPAAGGRPVVQYRWLSQTHDLDDPNSWQDTTADADGVHRFAFRQADSIAGTLCVLPSAWPDDATEQVGIDAARA